MSNAASVIPLLVGLFWIGPADAQGSPRNSPIWVLSVHGDQLTANLNHIPLRLVLAELARQVPLRLSLSEGLRDHPVTAYLRALPLDEALRHLLTGLSYAIFYSPAPSGAASAENKPTIELVVLDKAPAAPVADSSEAAAITSRVETGPGSAPWVETPPEWTAALEHPDKAVRLEALERWAEQGAATPLEPLTHALVDPDESVRARAQALVERVWAAKARAR
jgi:hypothetical protein